MVNPQVLQYIRTETAHGNTKEVIAHNLKTAGGWSDEVIQENFSIFESGLPFATIQNQGAVHNPAIFKTRKNIFIVNIVIFFTYIIISSVLITSGQRELAGNVLAFLYFLHVITLIALSVVGGLAQLITKRLYHPLIYFVMATFLGFVGVIIYSVVGNIL